MHACKSGIQKRKANIICVKPNQASQRWQKFGGESEYYLGLENEDKKMI